MALSFSAILSLSLTQSPRYLSPCLSFSLAVLHFGPFLHCRRCALRLWPHSSVVCCLCGTISSLCEIIPKVVALLPIVRERDGARDRLKDAELRYLNHFMPYADTPQLESAYSAKLVMISFQVFKCLIICHT